MNFKIGQVDFKVSGFSMVDGKIGFDLQIDAPILGHRVLFQATYRQMDNELPFEASLNVEGQNAEKSTNS